ncbi:MAG: hypothetical protein LBT65_10850 [Synergistaceae bacterium]|jgi:hypothetical protein|nr:hypothetical protein [Synergistaceae bacterium]
MPGTFRERFFGVTPRSLFSCLLSGLLLSAGVAFAGPFEETIQILERQTSFHWGRDCLVWVVHYPEDLVDPWVDAEAGRAGMTESERQSYKEGFVSELSIGKTEPFLFTVYAFGPRPLSFAPLSEKAALVTPEGKRVKPLRYDRVLDQPINGIAQGLVFFPKQDAEGYVLAVRGMGVYDERIFAFDRSVEALEPANEPDGDSEVVVVELPPAPKKTPAASSGSGNPRAGNAKPEPASPKVIERSAPTPPTIEHPTPPQPQGPEIVVTEPESESMADFVAAMRRGGAEKKAEENSPSPDAGSPGDSAYVSREKTIRDFLDLWMAQDSEKMYAMLSSASQELFSRENFDAELRKGADFRAALRDGYRVDWTSPERAKIVAIKRVLLIRTVASRTLGVAREGAAWKIVW